VESQTLCRVLEEAHGIKISYAHLQQKTYIRLVCVNPDMDTAFIDTLLSTIREIVASER
jgi:hypothetical protein